MSYDEHDAAMDEMYERISAELYPEHEAEAIEKFTSKRLRSFYAKYPMVMVPAVEAYREGNALLALGHDSAALIFFMSAVELFFKATLLKPVVYGLVHNDALAEVVVKHALGQRGFDRYNKLLANLFQELAAIDINRISRVGASVTLLKECEDLQDIRNSIVHQGIFCKKQDAELALAVVDSVYGLIVVPMIESLGLSVHAKGEIKYL